MKKHFLLFTLFLSFGFGFAQTKDSLSVEEQERRKRNIEAGNPFKKFGYTPKIATLSKGKYLEWHDLDSIVRIGSYSFHVKNKDITGYNMDEDKNSESTLRPELTSRWLSPDPLAEEFPSWSPYNFTMNNPIRFVDPDGRAPMDGIIIFKGGNISITSNIYLYGTGATKEVATQYQKDINSKWGGTFSAKTSNGSQSFNVSVDVNVALYEGKEKNNPWIISESWNPFNRDNFIEVGAGSKRSYVVGGDEGEWRSQGRNGLTLAQDNPAPHEVGHLLGLDDRYTDKNGPNKGWENNIMGNSQNGKVEQRNIDGILQDAMKAYEIWAKDKNNAGKEFRYEINTNNPNK